MLKLPVLCAAADACGGCPEIGLPLALQRAGKLSRVRESAAAQGLRLPPIEWLTDGNSTGYRNRIRLRLDAGVPQFFNQGKSSACVVLRPELREALPALKSWAETQRRSPSEAERHAWLRYSHLELRAPDADGTGSVCLFFPAGRGTALADPTGAAPSPSAASVPLLPSAPFGDWFIFSQSWPEKENVRSPPTQRFVLCDEVFAHVPVTGFMQVNTGVNQLMVARVREIAQEIGAKTFLDLFCGSGNLSLPLLKDGLRGAGAELDVTAIAALCRAAAEQGLDASRYVAGDARSDLFASQPKVDLLITDPPRAGLGGEAARLAALTRDAVLVAHCHLASFARDIAALSATGLALERVIALDMFPHTAQLELLSVLRRPGDRAKGGC